MPEFQNKGHRYIFEWPEYELRAEVSRINQNHDAVKCQVIFTTTNKDDSPHLLQTRLTMDSLRSRSEVANEMERRYEVKGKPIKWKSILEYLSIKSIKEFEKGEPVINVTSTDDVEDLQYLIRPIAPLGKPTVLFGDPGSGKSQLSVIFLMLTGLPWHDNPLRLGVKDDVRHTGLILDWEADEQDIRRQLKAFTEGMDLGYMELKYRRCTLPLADDIEAIRAHVEDSKADYVIVDSISLAAGGDLNRMDCATEYFRALRQLNVTSISLAHTSKDRENKSKTILGTVLFEAGARSVWEVRGQEDDDSLDIAMFHRKSNLTKKNQPLGFKISYNRNGNIIEWHDPTNVAEFVERMGINQRITELLKDGPRTEKEIIELLEINKSSFRSAKLRLKNKNIIRENSGKIELSC